MATDLMQVMGIMPDCNEISIDALYVLDKRSIVSNTHAPSQISVVVRDDESR